MSAPFTYRMRDIFPPKAILPIMSPRRAGRGHLFMSRDSSMLPQRLMARHSTMHERESVTRRFPGRPSTHVAPFTWPLIIGLIPLFSQPTPSMPRGSVSPTPLIYDIRAPMRDAAAPMLAHTRKATYARSVRCRHATCLPPPPPPHITALAYYARQPAPLALFDTRSHDRVI